MNNKTHFAGAQGLPISRAPGTPVWFKCEDDLRDEESYWRQGSLVNSWRTRAEIAFANGYGRTSTIHIPMAELAPRIVPPDKP